MKGVYSHLSAPDDREISTRQRQVFETALADAEACGHVDFERMLASSRVMINYPDWPYSAIDPGRFIYGALDGEYMKRARLKPLMHAIRGRIVHVQTHPPGTMLGIGYGAPIRIETTKRLAIVPIGFWDGLNHVPPLSRAIVNGQFVSAIGRRTFQHTLLDISDIPDAGVGSLVTFMGSSGEVSITIDQLAQDMGVPVMEATFDCSTRTRAREAEISGLFR